MKRRAFRLRVAGVATAAALVAAVLTASATAVQNGALDNGRHPYVGAVVQQSPDGAHFELCSGSLVSPTVVVTAAHCFPFGNRTHVTFDEFAINSQPSTWPGGTVHIDPAWCPGCAPGLPGFDTNDIAVVVLDEPVTLPQYAQLPLPGYDDTLPNNQRVEIVGYGLQNVAPPGFGIRMDGPAKIIPGGGSIGDEFLKLSSSPGQGAATCSGDSGGPDLQLGTNLMLAITTFGPNTTCKAVAYSTRMDTVHALGFVGSFLH